jgi:hypothetical protein
MDLPLILPVYDDGELHEVELSSLDKAGFGHGRLLDHDESMVAAFTAFGAKKPKCLEVLLHWETEPLGCLLTYGRIPLGRLIDLALRWSKVVVPLYADAVNEPEAQEGWDLAKEIYDRNIHPGRFGSVPDLLQHADDNLHERIETLGLPYAVDNKMTNAYDAARSVLNLLQAVKWYQRWRIAQTDPLLVDVDPGSIRSGKPQAREAVLTKLGDSAKTFVRHVASASAEAAMEQPYADELTVMGSPGRRKQIMSAIAEIRKVR